MKNRLVVYISLFAILLVVPITACAVSFFCTRSHFVKSFSVLNQMNTESDIVNIYGEPNFKEIKENGEIQRWNNEVISQNCKDIAVVYRYVLWAPFISDNLIFGFDKSGKLISKHMTE